MSFGARSCRRTFRRQENREKRPGTGACVSNGMKRGQVNHIVAILSFHKIGVPSIPEWDTWFYIPEHIFAAQLEWLRTNQWHIVTIADFLRGLAEPDSLAERTALLTFDDGYRSTATVALPCLQRFRFPG